MRKPTLAIAVLIAVAVAICATEAVAHDGAVKPPKGFVALFNGENLDDWWGLGTEHYNKYRNLSARTSRNEKPRAARTSRSIGASRTTSWSMMGTDSI